MDKYQLEEKIQELREEKKEAGAIRAYLNGHTDCPKCGWIMPFAKANRDYTHCLNPECEIYGILYRRPSVELIPVDGTFGIYETDKALNDNSV